eukprot:CAMPEP_0171693024 /NCGR_PEP_ID=MMETSP0991-20121206/6407_1 /TAXON_ID=483369 /ORGANISM="non described non described, Strain CCMP2098" /LENGTH=732 /DNA_ID=CAMNT_0012281403 /DNA_START=126 /DNA_END=2324 /DNA_ORIENTATION=+
MRRSISLRFAISDGHLLNGVAPLVSIQSTLQPQAFTLDILPPTAGGHAILGPNGSGKTLLTGALFGRGSNICGAETVGEWNERQCAVVSFESHAALLAEASKGPGGTMTVNRALRGPPLDDATKYLVVRFGLRPLLYRPVTSLSTGEIRKVLLARALSRRPELLVLDNAFDGLDVPSRVDFAKLISATLTGFAPMLVQGLSNKSTRHTQVLLVTQRPEEIVDEVKTVSTLSRFGDVGDERNGLKMTTKPRAGRAAVDLFSEWAPAPSSVYSATGSSPSAVGHLTELAPLDVLGHSEDSGLPSEAEVLAVWRRGTCRTMKQHCGIENSMARESSVSLAPVCLVVAIDNGPKGSRPRRPNTKLKAPQNDVNEPRYNNASKEVDLAGEGQAKQKDETEDNEAVLLRGLDWTILQGQHWWVAGGNGAGKSTLSRLLALPPSTNQGAGSQKRSGGLLNVLGLSIVGNEGLETDSDINDNIPPLPSPPNECLTGDNIQPLHRSDASEDKCHGGAGIDLVRDGIGWVSTELHLRVASSSTSSESATSVRSFLVSGITAGEVLAGVGITAPSSSSCSASGASGNNVSHENMHHGLADEVTCAAVARWLRLTSTCAMPFNELSQGQQKMILLGAALAQRPSLLVLDEPCQGLDPNNRKLFLQVVERVCQATRTMSTTAMENQDGGKSDECSVATTLVYITHHPEEVPPCVSHVIHLAGGEATFIGERSTYSTNKAMSPLTK